MSPRSVAPVESYGDRDADLVRDPLKHPQNSNHRATIRIITFFCEPSNEPFELARCEEPLTANVVHAEEFMKEPLVIYRPRNRTSDDKFDRAADLKLASPGLSSPFGQPDLDRTTFTCLNEIDPCHSVPPPDGLTL